MVREISPPQARYMTVPPTGPLASRIPVPSSSRRQPSDKSPSRSTSLLKSSTGRRSVLGDRSDVENIPLQASTSRSSLLKSRVSSSAKRTPIFVPRVTSGPTSPSSIRTTRRFTPATNRASSIGESSHTHSALTMSTTNMSVDPDATMLLDTQPPSFAWLSSPVTSELGEKLPRDRRSVMGPGRMMTPEDSQEASVISAIPHRLVFQTRAHPPSPTATTSAHRLPTPPSSQSSDELSLSIAEKVSRIHPRPAPTPPRPSASSEQRTDVIGPSPNPRKKKNPRVQQALQSPSRDRSLHVSSLTGLSRLVGTSSQPAPSTPISTLSQVLEERVLPSTAPAASRKPRKSMPTTKKSAPRARARQSLPAPNRRSRKSLTPAAIEKLTGVPVGVLDQPVEAEPGDDPLLLRGKDDDIWLAQRRLSRSQSLANSQMSARDGSHREDGSSQPGPSRLRQVITLDELDESSQITRPTRKSSIPKRSPSLAAQTLAPGSSCSLSPRPSPLATEFPKQVSLGSPGLPAEYDMSFDAAPGWASDDSSDADVDGEPADESAHNAARSHELVHDTAVHNHTNEGVEQAYSAPLTPIVRSVLAVSTTPLVSPPIESKVTGPVSFEKSNGKHQEDDPHRDQVTTGDEETSAYDFSIDDIVTAVENRSFEGDTTFEADPEDWDEPKERDISTTPISSPTARTWLFDATVASAKQDVDQIDPEDVQDARLNLNDDLISQVAESPLPPAAGLFTLEASLVQCPDVESKYQEEQDRWSGAPDIRQDEVSTAVPLVEVVDEETESITGDQDKREPFANVLATNIISESIAPQEAEPVEELGDDTEEAISLEWELSVELKPREGTRATEHDAISVLLNDEEETFAITSIRGHGISSKTTGTIDVVEQTEDAEVAAGSPEIVDGQDEVDNRRRDEEETSFEHVLGHGTTTGAEGSDGTATESQESGGAADKSFEDKMSSFEDDSVDVNVEADKVFERYISIPRSPLLAPIQTVPVSSKISPSRSRYTNSPSTPVSTRKLAYLTPKRNLGSPYRMVVSPTPFLAPQDRQSSPEGAEAVKSDGAEEVVTLVDSEPIDDNVPQEDEQREAETHLADDNSEAHDPLSPFATEAVGESTTVLPPDLESHKGGSVREEQDSIGQYGPPAPRTDRATKIREATVSEDRDRRSPITDGIDDHNASPKPSYAQERNLPGACEDDQQKGASYEIGDGKTDHDTKAESMEERIRTGRGPTEDEDFNRTNGLSKDAVTNDEEAPVRQSSRIVLRLVSKGAVKVERPSDPAEIVAPQEEIPAFAEASSTPPLLNTPLHHENNSTPQPGRIPGNNMVDPIEGSNIPLSEPTSLLAVLDHSSSIAAVSADVAGGPAPAETQSSAPSVHRYANANSTGGISSLERMLQRRRSSSTSSSHGPSRLSLYNFSAEQAERFRQEDSQAPRPRARGRRSLGEELLAANAADDSFEEGNESFRSVVEVSSLDPRAAARAAAILKLNHAYIEHGVLPSTSASNSIPLPTPTTPATMTPRTPRSGRRQRGYESKHFATVDSARKLNREELLYEAELEIVQSRRSRSRSRARSLGPASVSGWESDETEYALPGGWKRTPGQKRKRAKSMHHASRPEVVAPGETVPEGQVKKDGRPWGVPEWKRLEKVFRAEKEAWIKAREIKPLPGLFGWAKKALTGAREVQEWDDGRVAKRFLDQEGAHGLAGEWSEKLIRLRVKALEKRVNAPKAQTTTASTRDERTGKKQRTEEKRAEPIGVVPSTPRREEHEGDSTVVSIVPPSTIRRMLGYVWSKSAGETSVIEEAPEADTPSRPAPSRTRAMPEVPVKKVENKLLTRLKAVREPLGQPPSTPSAPSVTPITARRDEHVTPMRQTIGTWVPEQPSSPAWRTPPIPGAFRSHFNAPADAGPSSVPSKTTTSGKDVDQVDQRPSGMVTPNIYPTLNPSLSQRSSALRALFETPSSGSSKSVTIPPRKGRQSVSALVRSFEEEGMFARSYEKEKGRVDELRRVQSRGA